MQNRTIADIARAIEGEAVGDTGLTVRGLAEPQSAGPKDLAVAMDPQYAEMLGRGGAKAAVLWQGADWLALGLQAAVLVTRPRLAMAGLTNAFMEKEKRQTGIHATAIIASSAKISDTASVGPYAIISDDVKISDGVTIGAHVSVGMGSVIGEGSLVDAGARIGRNVRIGRNCFIHSGAVLGADGFSFVTAEKSVVEDVRESLGENTSAGQEQAWLKIQSLGGVTIGDNVEVGANSSIDAGTIRPTTVGEGTKIDALVQVGHNVIVGRHCLLCAHVAVGGSAKLGNAVVLGGQVGVADNISLGDGVVAGGASKILSSVPAGRALLGYPATKMSTHIETYKALRRLPKLLKDVATLKKEREAEN